jgi:uncharacterized membrane-anchored protein
MIHKKFLLIGLFWLLIFGGFIGAKEYTLQTGKEILLKTRPVDPRDLFRGDYVVLSYDISSIDLATINSDRSIFNPGEEVYVSLDDQGGCARPIKIDSVSPKDGIFMKGKINTVYGNNLTIEYGIESYFVPEGKGREIESKRGQLVVRAAADKSGNSAIKSLLPQGSECN